MCTCGYCLSKDGKRILRTYSCAGCARRVPWCYGGGGDADDMPEHCDDCWLEAHPQEGA